MYGFEEGDVLNSAVLQAPVKLCFIEDKDVMTYRAGQPVAPLLKPSDYWLVPVAIGGTNRAMIEVTAAGEGKWTGSALGMAPLARKWQNLQGWWPEAQKFTPRLIICPPVPGYFFSIPQAATPNLTPMSEVPATIVDHKVTPKPALKSADAGFAGIREVFRQVNAQSETSTNK
jgi:hypothetical protein